MKQIKKKMTDREWQYAAPSAKSIILDLEEGILQSSMVTGFTNENTSEEALW